MEETEKFTIEQIALVRDLAIRADERANSAHIRVDEHAVKFVAVELAQHKLSGRTHVVEGIMTGIEGAIGRLNKSVDEWAVKTDNNTTILDKGEATVKTAISAFKIGVIVIGTLGAGFAGFIVYATGEFLHWWMP